jgi:hypothetical protein
MGGVKGNDELNLHDNKDNEMLTWNASIPLVYLAFSYG